MSLTLRGMLGSAWDVIKYVNPITGPYFIGKAIFESKPVKDSIDIAADTTVKAGKALAAGTNAVLDYDIEKGAKTAYNTTAQGVNYAYNKTVDGVNATIEGVEEAYDATVDTVADGIVTGIQTVDDTQKGVRRGVADWIAPDEPVKTAVQPTPKPEAPAAPAGNAKVAMPKTPAETKAFQEKFNAWLASDAGKEARELGVAKLKPDSILGPATKAAIALYNAS